MKKRFFAAFAILGVLALSFAGNFKNISLKWKTTDSITDYQPTHINTFRKYTFNLEQIIDERSNKTDIGQNTEHRNSKAYTTTDNVSQFVLINSQKVFNEMRVKTDSLTYDFKIIGKLHEFYVSEENTFKGTVQIDFIVFNKSNDTVASCVAAGGSNRWGRSYSEANYLECISNALFSCICDFMSQCEIH